MDFQKAIELQKAFKRTYKSTPADVDDACNMAMSALEKQIPKKVEYGFGYVENAFTRYRMAKCPNCERWHSSRDGIIYCSNCGQKLDWSDVD